MTNGRKQAAVLFSPQDTSPELEEQTLEEITGGGEQGAHLQEGFLFGSTFTPGGDWMRTSEPYLGRSGKFSSTVTRAIVGPVTETQKDAIKTFDSEYRRRAKLKPLNILKK
jgi:hypothetical protein